jgi:hypothetical protein
VSDMQGAGPADVLLYFKGPVTQQIRRPVNAYEILTARNRQCVIFVEICSHICEHKNEKNTVLQV